MLLKTEKNWKGMLTPEDEQRLNALLEQIKRHRAAYLSADDVKIAQIWCAILEMQKEAAALDVRLKRIEYILNGMFARANKADESSKKLFESLGRF